MDRHHQPWYRTPAATFAAGGVGLLLIAALVMTVVRMSDQWTVPVSTTFTTTSTLAPQTIPAGERVDAATTSDTPTSYTMPSFSTTETYPPSDQPSTTDTSGTPTSSPPPLPPPPAAPTTVLAEPPREASTAPSTTRQRPRLNVTRTLSP
jgi:hypothetical protein